MLYLDALPTCVTGPDQMPVTAGPGATRGGAGGYSTEGGGAPPGEGSAAGGPGNGCAGGNCCARTMSVGPAIVAARTKNQIRKACTVRPSFQLPTSEIIAIF